MTVTTEVNSLLTDLHHPCKMFVLLAMLSIFALSKANDDTVPIRITKAPYKVSILPLKNRDHVLGAGAILNAKWAVTTASAIEVHRYAPNTVLVRSGSGQYNTAGGLHVIDKIVIHPDFKGNLHSMTGQGDIALLRLVHQFILSMTVAPIPLPTQTPSTNQAHLVSWPMIGSKKSQQLRAMSTKTQDWIQCFKTCSLVGLTLDPRTVCTNEASYQGEEGDPLVIAAELAGLYRKNPSSKAASLPQVYVEIPSYREWIQFHITAPN